MDGEWRGSDEMVVIAVSPVRLEGKDCWKITDDTFTVYHTHDRKVAELARDALVARRWLKVEFCLNDQDRRVIVSANVTAEQRPSRLDPSDERYDPPPGELF